MGMITKGIIVQLPEEGSNIYKVRVPLFEQPGSSDENRSQQNNLGSVVLDATACVTPGLSHGYQVDDIVYIGFENNKYQKAVILGQLYLANNKEPANNYYNINNLNVNGIATLPSNTKLGDYTIGDINSLIIELHKLQDMWQAQPEPAAPIEIIDVRN